jgi:polyphosphate kinase
MTSPPVTAPEAERSAGELPYTNRELSWLDFNERVLDLACDEPVPLLERAKFLAIFHSNLDEFFMVRVAGLQDQVEAGVDARQPDGMSPAETLKAVAERAHEMVDRQSRIFTDSVARDLAEKGIRIITCEECNPEELSRLDEHFQNEILPTLTPLAVGPGRPFPYISNLSLSLAVVLWDPVEKTEGFARVKVPKEVLPRFFSIGDNTFVPLEAVMARHLDALFPGMEVVHSSTFRVTRDADFTVSDEADDLVRAVEDELRRRRFGEVVRLEVGSNMRPDIRARLVEWLDVKEEEVYDVEGLLDLTDLWEIHGIDGYRELRDPPWSPVTSVFTGERAEDGVDVFAAMRERDVLVHFPYDSFSASVERFVKQAVDDPNVLAIKMTVYRTSPDSSLIPSLIEAAERGKQAVCVVELKARFDERRNIGWALALEEAGAHVVHGLPGLKTHAKAVLVVRREGKGVRHYVQVGTGNYNAKTARLYEDYGLFTTDPDIAADVSAVFNLLTGFARPQEFRKLLVSPSFSREGLIEEIEETVAAHEAGEHARIVLKMNALTDPALILALYEASQAGVPIDLNVRGMCSLQPGVEGLSETIRVVSVVGRFLEHSRIYAFERGESKRIYIGSADLMGRNLDHRVELLVPVEDPRLQEELEDTLERCLADDTFSWELGSDQRWHRRSGGERSVHRELMERALEREAQADKLAAARRIAPSSFSSSPRSGRSG